MKTLQKGFTLIELMIVVAIIGILAALALPAYQKSSNRAAFAELVLAVLPLKTAIEIAIQTRNPGALSDLDSGAFGIPASVSVASTVHGASVLNGGITMVWRTDDGAPLANTTYILTAASITPPVQWLEGGTCLTTGLC